MKLLGAELFTFETKQNNEHKHTDIKLKQIEVFQKEEQTRMPSYFENALNPQQL